MHARFSMRSAAALGAALSLLSAASGAAAHAHLVSSTPEANSTGPAPKAVTLHFTEAVTPMFTGFTLTKADGGSASVTTNTAPDDAKTLIGMVGGRLSPGVYTVTWHATAASNGHKTNGDFSFTVR
jgi:hypothetical protein